jgi:transposase
MDIGLTGFESLARRQAVVAAAAAADAADPSTSGARLHFGPAALDKFLRLGREHQQVEYRQWFTDHHVPNTAKERRAKMAWIRYQYTTFYETGSTADRPRSGRPRLLRDYHLETAVRFITENHLRTQREYNNTPTFKSILEQARCSADTLWQRLHEYEPLLAKHWKVEYRRRLTPDQVKKRIVQSCRWLRLGVNTNAAGVHEVLVFGHGTVPLPPSPSAKEDELRRAYELDWLLRWAKRIIWMDEKVIYICPTDHEVWGIGPGGTVVEDIRKLRPRPWRIKYISAVNYYLGGVMLVLVSGTWAPDYEPAKVYR